MAAKTICLVNDDECGGDKNIPLMCLADRNKKLNKSQFPKARTEAQAILYRADIDGEPKVDLGTTFICGRHFTSPTSVSGLSSIRKSKKLIFRILNFFTSLVIFSILHF